MTDLKDLARREWQPIETAPPERVLVLLPEFSMGDLPPLPPRVAIRHMADIEDNAREIRQPTHWMPLPEALAAKDARIATNFHDRVHDWMLACFGIETAADKLERADRFIEEALELAQTNPDFTADRAHALVDYVFGRPVGDAFQEVGGVRVTLAALCNASNIDADKAAETELARVWTKVEQIRAKQAAKPTGSALPIALKEKNDER